jgi:hypothetical protein
MRRALSKGETSVKVGMKKKKPTFAKSKHQSSTVLELRKDTEALKQLEDLEELVGVPVERGGVYFSDWERKFIKDVRRQHDDTLVLSPNQRAKIKEIWQLVDLRKRERPDEKPANLFSNLSPKEQARQREKAKGILPWEK